MFMDQPTQHPETPVVATIALFSGMDTSCAEFDLTPAVAVRSLPAFERRLQASARQIALLVAARSATVSGDGAAPEGETRCGATACEDARQAAQRHGDV